MNDRIQSHVRHILTALFAGAVLFLKHQFVSQAVLIDALGSGLNQAIDPLTLMVGGYIGSVILKAVAKWPWLQFFIGYGNGSGGNAAMLWLVMCTMSALLMAGSLTSCSTISTTRTDAKGATVETITKSFDTGVATLISQGLTIFGAKQPKPPKPATTQPILPATGGVDVGSSK